MRILLSLFRDQEVWEKALKSSFCKGIDREYIEKYRSVKGRDELMAQIGLGEKKISPPHLAEIPKPGEFENVFDEMLKRIIKKQKMRQVWVLLPEDRILMSAINIWLFKYCGHMVHRSCYSYQEGIGCSKVVQKLSRKIVKNSRGCSEGPAVPDVGWKSDLSKYFDSVPIEYVDEQWDKVEASLAPDGKPWGKDPVIEMLREFYHDDRYYLNYHRRDEDLREHPQSLKQGVAVASWLADVVLYHIDEKLDSMGLYARYSDDQIFVGPRYKEAMEYLRKELQKMRMDINEKKREWIRADKWVKFLGFAIKGKDVSISKNRLATFEQEVRSRTVDAGVSYDIALRKVQKWLYYGDGEHSWATGMLKTVNVKQDICRMNAMLMDCLRACATGKDDLGGLGWDNSNGNRSGVIARGKGRNVRANREKTGDDLAGFYSLNCMRNRLLNGRDVYDATVREILRGDWDKPRRKGADFKFLTYNGKEVTEKMATELLGDVPTDLDEWLDRLEDLYDEYKYSVPTKKSMKTQKRDYFKALTVEELGREGMKSPVDRDEAQRVLEVFVIWGFASGLVQKEELFAKDFFFQGTDKGLVLMKDWIG